MNFCKKLTAILLSAVMLLGCAGCGSKSSDDSNNIPESTGGHDIVRSAEADDVFSLNCNMNYSFNPLIATNHSNQLVCGLVYENMVEIDNDFNVIPNIIVEWSFTDDGKSWTFEMDTENPHIFHDGTQVTGKDLRYSLERAIYADRYEGRFSSVQGVSYSDTQLFVTIGIGDTDFIKLMNIPVIKAGTFDEDYPTGSGPYMYNEDYTELHPHEEHFKKSKPPVDVVYLKQYSDAEAIISAFEDGLVDLALNDPSSYTNLGYANSNEIHTYATTNMHYVMFNMEKGICADSTFRYAMNYAFDRSYLVTLLSGNAVASPVPMYPTCENYPSSLATSLQYDLNTCRIVLENAGVRDYDEDGKMEYMSAANPVELTFIVCSDSSAKAGIVGRFASDMEALGITVNVQELTWTEYRKALLTGEFDMYYGEMKLRNNFDISKLVEVRDEELNERYGPDDEGRYYVVGLQNDSNLNFTRSKDPTCLDYVHYYLGASPIEKKSAYKSMCDYVTSNGILITIGFEQQQIISHRGAVKGMDANMGNPLWNFSDWTISIG